MFRLLNRELYLWQGILIFLIVSGVVLFAGVSYTSKVIAENENPIPKIDQEMLAVQKRLAKKQNPDDYVKLGKIYYEKDSISDAKKAYLKALKLQENHLEALYNLGLVYLHEKNFVKAEKYFSTVVMIHPKHSIAKFTLAQVYIDIKQYEKAEEQLETIEDDFATVADYFYLRGLVAEKLDREDNAADFFERALNFDPEYVEAKAGLSRVTQEENKISD